MKFLRDTGKKKSTGRLVRVLAAFFAVVFAFASLPATDASADTSKALNPGYIFRDETPDLTGIPAYYHKGVKYAQLNENEKKIFDQVVLLHLYLTDANKYNSLLTPYLSCFSNIEETYNGEKVSFFSVSFRDTNSSFDSPSIEVSKPKSYNASGAAIDYYNATEIGTDKGLQRELLFGKINLQSVTEALFVDLPDLFWWDKTLWSWKCMLMPVSGTNSVKMYNITLSLAAQRNESDTRFYYTKDSITTTMAKINSFANRVISEVESKGFWETIKGGRGAAVTEIPGVLSDYDKLLGTAILIEKLVKFDQNCKNNNNDVNYANKSSVGIDCVAQYDEWGTHLYNSSDVIEAVCEGYSEIFKYICDRTKFYNPVNIGIEIGYTGNGKLDVSGYERHEWNVASINGYEYVIDLTNDDVNKFVYTLYTTDTALNIKDEDNYKYKGVIWLKGKEPILSYTQPSNNEGYYIGFSLIGYDENGSVKQEESLYYLFDGTPYGKDLITEAVRYEPYEKDFIDKSKCSAKLYVPEGGGNYVLDTTFNSENGTPRITYKSGNVGDRTLIVWAENASLIADSYDYELIKGDGTLVTRSSLSYANNPYIVIGDPFSFAPGEYSIYLYAKDGSYEFPVAGPKFTVLPATLTPSVAVKNGSGKVTIASSEINNDLKDRFEIKLEGVASGDEVSSQITNLQLTNVVDSTTTTEGSAGVSATFRLTGSDAQNYVLADNYTTTVTLDNAITISKKQPATNPDQGGTTGGGTSGGGTVGGGTVGGETTGGETVGGGTVGGGTVGGGTSGGGTVGGGSVGGGTSGGGGVSGGGAAIGGGSSSGGGAPAGGGATSGGTDSTKKDDETAGEKKDDKASDEKKDDKAADDKKDDKITDDKKENDGTVVVENEDGSVTTTNISVNKKGSVIVESVTENTDGSTVETRVKTTKSGKVTETNVEKDADGNVLSTVESSYSVSSKGTVKMTAIETDEKEVEIPKTVEVAGEERTVTQIAKYALKNNKTMTSARIGENITSIGAGAFKNNKKLKTIELTDSVKKVYKNAFKGIAKNAVFKIKASSKKKFDKIVALLKASGVSDTVTFEMVE